MCTEMYRKMQTKKTYSEVVSRMRASKVVATSVGSEFLKYAVLAYLHNSQLTIDEIAVEAMDNVATSIHGLNSERVEEAIMLMREALETVNMRFEDDNTRAVEKYIKIVAEEVRIAEMVQLRIISYGINANPKQAEALVQIAIRRMRKPEHDFNDILNWVAGRFDYDNVLALLADLDVITRCSDNYKYIARDLGEKAGNCTKSDNILEVLQDLEARHYEDEIKEQITNTKTAIVAENMNMVDILLKEKDNLIF